MRAKPGAFLLMLLATNPCAAVAFAQSADEAAIRKQMAAYEDARKKGDLNAEAAIFTSDAEMWLAVRNEWYSGATLKSAFASTPDPPVAWTSKG